MAKFFRITLSCLCMALFFGSCIFEYPPEMEGDGAYFDKDKVMIQLNIQPLAASASTNPTERLKSLRVVIIGKGEDESVPDTIECNRLIDIPESAALNYSYTQMWYSKPGTKDIFVIANESSVDANLPALLNGYAENGQARDFIDRVSGYSFSPVYTVDKNNNIFLPYTFIREGITPQPGLNTINAWLVPVATKFIFNFTNNRADGIKVNGISLKYANTSNYLLAHLGKDELTKEYNDQTLSWLDWLAEISKNSWTYPDYSGNVGYNDEVGWILDYKLPVPDDKRVFTFVDANDADQSFIIPKATKQEIEGVETTNPGKYSTQMYYLPESANLELPEGESSGNEEGDEGEDDGQGSAERAEHTFYLTLLFEDTAEHPSRPPEFKDVAIPNLKALFRNTYVVINVTMSEGDIEVYAEIAYWNKKTANGWVNEGTAPSPNPF